MTGDLMHPGIDANGATNLAEHILTGGDEIPELGLTRSVLTRSRNPGNDVLWRYERALSGERRFHRACAQTVAEMPGRISSVLLNLLAHGRCDAFAWIILARHVEWVNLPGPMGGRTVMSGDGQKDAGVAEIADTHVFLGNGSYWTGEGVLDVRLDVPETVVIAAVGRPLASLMSHPALDGIPMLITGVKGNGSDGHIITTDYAGWPAERRSIELARMTDEHVHPALAFG